MMRMFVFFGEGKCPLCGDSGKKMPAETYHCGRCAVAFNEFYISVMGETKPPENKFWN